jgi:LuxR family maltose regulon positive regulatory protein
LLGWAERINGRPEAADDLFAETCEEARVFSAPGRTPLVLQLACAERATLAMDRGEWSAAGDYSEQAAWAARHSRFDEVPLNSVLYAVAARVALHGDRAADATRELAEAQRLLAHLTRATPQAAVHVRLQVARAYLAMADQAGARTVLGEVDAILRRVPDLGTLVPEAEELRGQLGARGLDVHGISTLTAAELRILPLMATHLTYREIGERRFLSGHTVKSHAMSIYRKLDVRSRSEAVDRARAAGLL